MATRRIDPAQILQVLEELGIVSTTVPQGYTAKQLSDLLKDYGKYSTPGAKEVIDLITPKYESNEKMIDAFTRVEEGFVPEEIINELGSRELSLTPTEEQDLKDYYTMVGNRREAAAIRQFELEQATGAAGLVGAAGEFNIPTSVVQRQFRDQYGGKPVTTFFEDAAAKAIKDWEESPGFKNQKMVSVPTGRTTRNVKAGDDFGRALWNLGIDSLQGAVENSLLGPTLRKFGIPIGGPDESSKMSVPEMQKVPEYNSKRNYAELVAQMAENERQKDLIVQQTLNRALTREYGSPMEAQIDAIASRISALNSANNKKSRR